MHFLNKLWIYVFLSTNVFMGLFANMLINSSPQFLKRTNFTIVSCLEQDGYNPDLLIVCCSNTLQYYSKTNKSLSLIAGSSSSTGYKEGHGSQAHFDQITDVIQINKTSFLVAEQNNCLRLVVDRTTFPFAGKCGPTKDARDGWLLDARFLAPVDMQQVGDYLYVTEINSIRKIDLKAGQVSTIATFQDEWPQRMACVNSLCNRIYVTTLYTGILLLNVENDTLNDWLPYFPQDQKGSSEIFSPPFNFPSGLLALSEDILLVADQESDAVYVINVHNVSYSVIKLKGPTYLLQVDDLVYVGTDHHGIIYILSILYMRTTSANPTIPTTVAAAIVSVSQANNVTMVILLVTILVPLAILITVAAIVTYVLYRKKKACWKRSAEDEDYYYELPDDNQPPELPPPRNKSNLSSHVKAAKTGVVENLYDDKPISSGTYAIYARTADTHSTEPDDRSTAKYEGCDLQEGLTPINYITLCELNEETTPTIETEYRQTQYLNSDLQGCTNSHNSDRIEQDKSISVCAIMSDSPYDSSESLHANNSSES